MTATMASVSWQVCDSRHRRCQVVCGDRPCNSTWRSTGWRQMYMWNVSEDQRTINWIMWSSTPATASVVAPPERIEWPPTSLPNDVFRHKTTHDYVGTLLAAVSQSSGCSGKCVSRAKIYLVNAVCGQVCVDGCRSTRIVLPSKKRSPL